jgi:citrate synthase
MATLADVQDGLEGVLAFATEIAEPDRAGGSLRYRGIDIEQLVGTVPFEVVWGLLVADRLDQPLPAARALPLPLRSGDARVDLQVAIAALAARWKLAPLVDATVAETQTQLERISAQALEFTAQSARGTTEPAVPDAIVDQGATLAERFLLRWRGELDPTHAGAIDAYWITAAEHGMNASTFTARVIASTGADAAAAVSGAVGALSGPLHGGAPARVLQMLDEVEHRGDADAYVRDLLDRGERIMGFGHRVYRAEDPRARALRRVAERLGSPRLQVAAELERAALAALADRRPDRVLATNVEYWAAVMLDHAQVPQQLFTSVFACARMAGWSAHILEQRQRGRLVRPGALYVGAPERPLAARPVQAMQMSLGQADVPGHADVRATQMCQ